MGLVIFIFVAVVVVRFAVSSANRKTYADTRARAQQALTAWRSIPGRPSQWQIKPSAEPGEASPPSAQPPQARQPGPPTFPTWTPPPVPAATAPAAVPDLPDLPYVADHPVSTDPQIVSLTPHLQRRVLQYMEQGFEVMAVRLVCDEPRAGILDAQKTVRTLAGLPSPY